MAKLVYLDNNATTKCDQNVVDAILPFIEENFFNPSSPYTLGKDVRRKITDSRKAIAKLVGATPEEILFTSGATESNVSAIMSLLKLNPAKKHIITSCVEHSSILETMKYLETIGYSVTYLTVDKYGKINTNELEKHITANTALITVMMANNETGNLYPITQIGEIAESHNIPFHCDAVQAVGKIKINVQALGVTSLSMSGHKVHAPKGVGALYIKRRNFSPLIFGHQENELRGGTENVPGIIGLGRAAKNILEDDYADSERIKSLRDFMEKEITDSITDTVIYGDRENRIPNTTCIGFRNVNAQELMYFLESANILVSIGSACNSAFAEPSHVLTAMDADLENYPPIRISLSKYTTKEEIIYFIENLKVFVNKLRK